MPTREINGTTLHYIDQGQGRPLVLLHAFPLDCRMWRHQVQVLSHQYRVIAPDLRGFGQSRSADPFTMESLADDVHALLRKIGAVPCVIGGASMGGYVTLAFCRKCPPDVEGLVLISTRADGDAPEARENRDRMVELVRSGGSSAVAEKLLPRIVSPKTLEHRREIVAELRGMMDACPPLTVEHGMLAMRDRTDHTDLLPSIADPVLIVSGEDDMQTPPEVAREMQKQMPHARLVPVADAGHMCPVEQSEQVNEAIRQFMARMR